MSGGGKKKITLSGGDNEGVPPVPIPNTEVKPFSADGTWLETARESRSLPDSISLRCFAAEHISFAGSPQSQWSRLPTGELAPFRLTLPPAGHPPQAAAGGSPGFHIGPLRKQRAAFIYRQASIKGAVSIECSRKKQTQQNETFTGEKATLCCVT